MLFNRSHLKHISLILFVLFFLATICATLPFKRIFLPEECKNEACVLSALLAREFNQTSYRVGKSYTLYTAGFNSNNSVPDITNQTTTSILWVGGHHSLYIDKIRNFDIVLTTSPLSREVLKKEGITAFYLPLFGYPLNKTELPTDNKFIALINNPPKVEAILKQKHLPYRHYTTAKPQEILNDMTDFKIAFVENTAFAENSLDLNPLFFTLAEHKIPLACFWGWPKVEENINIFNDMINFYLTDSEINTILEEVDSSSKRAEAAFTFVSAQHSLKSATERLKYILKHHREPKDTIPNNTINFDLPVSVGHTISGDYGLAKNLETELDKYGYHTSYSFYNSLYKYPAETNIIIRGMVDDNFNKTDKIHILYLAYPQFEGDGSRTTFEPEYYKRLLPLLKDFDAIATASESLADALKSLGLNAFYIPQFTNTSKFFPDYDETLKSEVFFVGRFAQYRRAPQAVINAGLPITIYGPDWQGFAKADAIDYNLLNKHYSSAKIVLNDTRSEMLLHGVISNRIFDATACEALVISDYMPEIEKIYGDTVPMWKTEAELIELIKYYLSPEHEAERKDKARRAREITLKHFTAEIAAKQFNDIITPLKQQKGLQ